MFYKNSSENSRVLQYMLKQLVDFQLIKLMILL